jgi:hypothetical protein
MKKCVFIFQTALDDVIVLGVSTVPAPPPHRQNLQPQRIKQGLSAEEKREPPNPATRRSMNCPFREMPFFDFLESWKQNFEKTMV